MTDTSTLPRWDPTALFPSLESREFAAAHEGLGADVARLVALYDEHGVGEVAAHAPTAEEVAAFEAVIDATNAVERARWSGSGLHLRLRHHRQPRRCRPGRATPTLERHEATLRQLSARFTAWVAALGPEALAAASPPGRRPRLPARAAPAARAEHQMGPGEEALYAELGRHRIVGAGTACTATSRRSCIADVHLRRRQRRDAADDRGARPGHPAPTRPCAGPPTTPSWRRGRRWPSPLRGGHERHQGRGQHRQRPPRLGRPARRVAVRQRRRPHHLRGHARPPSTPRCPTSVAGCGSRPASTATAAGCRGGTCSPRCRSRRATCRGTTGASIVTASFGRYSPAARRRWPAGPSTSAGSTPSRAPASAAARSACRSSATARSCC